ncbi:MAG: PD40 domain-containing protein [Dehalococcoidia bacterium]|nr:PD40 domain-containing protein [Dehalococcoidia bacterium]
MSTPSRSNGNGPVRLGLRLLASVAGGAMLLLAMGCSSGEDPKLAFVSDRDGNPEIYTVNVDGSEQTRLTVNNAVDSRPLWSPDRKWVAFVSEESGDPEINRLQVGPDEAKPQRLTHSPGDDHMHWWSPDGSRIAFISDRSGQPEVYVIGADGSKTGITRITSGEFAELRLDGWSSDGRWLAFVPNTSEEGPGIMIRNPDGVNLMRLTSFQDYDARWSPDNRKIVYTSERDGNQEIYVMNSDGSSQTRLTHNDSPDHSPSWSPDGLKIAFVSERDGNQEIYVMKADGAGVTRYTANDAVDESPVWSPDGKKLAFVSYIYNTGEIFVMNIADRNQTRLTNNNANDTDPVW